MGNWNLPPGCSDWQIPGNEPDITKEQSVGVKEAKRASNRGPLNCPKGYGLCWTCEQHCDRPRSATDDGNKK